MPGIGRLGRIMGAVGDYDAVILAGGTARRLGGVDKATIEVDGLGLLARVIQAAAGAGRVVVAGPVRPDLPASVIWCREDPPGGGPVAGLAAALPLLDASLVIVLAVDLPRIAPAVPVLLERLSESPSTAAAVLVDRDGRVNYLAAAWRRAALETAVANLPSVAGASVRSLYAGATVSEVADAEGWGADIDTPGDLRRARTRVGPL
jgi:molybdopterin-guanine dinucleotide biosynthesis protein A